MLLHRCRWVRSENSISVLSVGDWATLCKKLAIFTVLLLQRDIYACQNLYFTHSPSGSDRKMSPLWSIIRTSSRCSAKLQRFITRDSSLSFSLSPSHPCSRCYIPRCLPILTPLFLLFSNLPVITAYIIIMLAQNLRIGAKNVGVNIETKPNVDHSLLEEPWTGVGTRLSCPL